MQKVTTPRSVSSGTMRHEDLIPAFMSELEDRVNDNQYTNQGDELQLVAMNTRLTRLMADIETNIEEKPDYYDSEESTWDLDSLFDALEEFAGEGLMFGSHPGDGADYGYWPCEDMDSEEEPEASVPDYMVCQTCRFCNEYGHAEGATDDENEASNDALAALKGPGILVSNGDEYAEFVNSYCPLCHALPGSRYGLHINQLNA